MLSSSLKTRVRRALECLLLASAALPATVALALPASVRSLPQITVQGDAPQRAAPQTGAVAVLVELQGVPAAQVYAATLEAGKSGGSALASQAAVTAARAQISRNEAQHQSFSTALARSAIAATPIYRVTKAFNGLAYQVDPSAIPALRALAGVKAVHVIQAEFPTLSTSVPFLGTPAAWSGVAPLGVTGLGVKVGIIDTGVDYQHPAFGGTGLLTDYTANNRAVITDGFFPSARVVGGTDLAGDLYNGGTVLVPVPDPDPMDCNGHGTHVASIAAGGGVKADGTPFTGPYDGTTPFTSLRIGPGMAPQASIYAIRVFGCTGSTYLTVQAIDWSLDPNGDGDLSDHLDVINMSLGSTYGALSDTSAMASDNAAHMGVVVVASAGNSGDTYFVGGSPGTGQRVATVANSNDSGNPYFQVRVNSPAAIAGNFGVVGTSSIVNSVGTLTPEPNNETSDLVLSDTAPASTNLGCTAPLPNAANIAGKIVLIDRGTCAFSVKYNNAVLAGAIGVIIGNSTAAAGGMSGTVTTASIPAVMISLADKNAIKAQINLPATVNVTLLSAAVSGNLADILASDSSRGPIGGGGIGSVKPDMAAPGMNITAAQTGVTCTAGSCITPNASGYLADGKALTISGTSMAAPHAAGVMALLVQRFPDRSVEEIKAMAMNTSLHDIYQLFGNINRIGVDRVGAGRVDPTKALQGTVLAFNNEVAGAVSLSFVGEVVGSLSQTKKLRVENYGSTPQTFDLVIDTAVSAPGIAFSFPGGSSVTVPAGGTAFVDVQALGTAALMDHTRDPSAAATQGGNSRHYLTNASGYVNFTQVGSTVLRVPVYAALRPASDMTAPAVIVTGGSATGSTTIALTGTGVCTGTLAGSSCSGSFPVTDESLVSPFELQASAPVNPALKPSDNIKLVGVAYDAASDLILFGVSTWGDWGSPTEAGFDILIDSGDGAGYKKDLYNAYVTGAQDVFVNWVYTPATPAAPSVFGSYLNVLPASVANTVLFGSNVMVLAASRAKLGLAPGTTKFTYKIQTRTDQVGPLTWDYAAPGLDFGGNWLAEDLPGATLPVTWNTANMTANGSLGALLLHHHNASGKRAEVVVLDSAQSADLGVAQVLTPAAPAQGQNVTVALTATNAGPNNAAGVVVYAPLPAGLTYVSDTGGGAYVPATGYWTVGALANGGSTGINIVATVAGSGSMAMVSQISGSLLDTVPANDMASSTFMVAPQTTLAVTNVLATASPVLAGGAPSFTVTVRNTGIDTLLNVSVATNRAPVAAIASGTPSSGSFNTATGIWTIPSIAAGATVTLNLTLTAPSMIGALTVNAVATAENSPGAQLAAAIVNVLSPATVTATKTVAGSTFDPGSSVTYTVTLTNSAATAQLDNPGAEFTDVLPAGLVLVSASASGGTAVATPASNTVTWNGVIPPAGSVVITIVATLKLGTQGTTISNQATAAYDADGNGSNESIALTDDPGVAGAVNPTSFAVQFAAVTPVPTLSEMALVLLALLLLGVAANRLRGGRRT